MPGINLTQQTLKFPLNWHGRLIVDINQANGIERILHQTLHGCGLRNFQVSIGSTSAKGTYRTFLLTSDIPDIMTFRAITKALSTLPGVKMLL